MNTVSQENALAIACSIAQEWGLSTKERDQLLARPGQVNAVIAIYESLEMIFAGDKDRANEWPSKPNAEYGGSSALEIMLAGDMERVKLYLRYHLYNA